jgi:hypothetical protein
LIHRNGKNPPARRGRSEWLNVENTMGFLSSFGIFGWVVLGVVGILLFNAFTAGTN